MQPGTQIAYIPPHADNVNHPDVEFGFITSTRAPDGQVFCRYWQKKKLGTLRTIANSELTPLCRLVRYDSVMQATVNRLLEKLYPTI